MAPRLDSGDNQRITTDSTDSTSFRNGSQDQDDVEQGGVLLCVNMQMSFMHPPFGFALFYLRGIAPKELKGSEIYWGAY